MGFGFRVRVRVGVRVGVRVRIRFGVAVRVTVRVRVRVRLRFSKQKRHKSIINKGRLFWGWWWWVSKKKRIRRDTKRLFCFGTRHQMYFGVVCVCSFVLLVFPVFLRHFPRRLIGLRRLVDYSRYLIGAKHGNKSRRTFRDKIGQVRDPKRMKTHTRAHKP